MKTRSLGFQLSLWYAVVMACAFAVLGVLIYAGLKGYLDSNLKETQLRRTRQISRVRQAVTGADAEARWVEEVKAMYAPEIANNQFIRVTRNDGATVFVSDPPRDGSFDPGAFARPRLPQSDATARKVLLSDGREMLIAANPVLPGYLIEAGTPMDPVAVSLRHLLLTLATILPLAALVAAVGGYFLIQRALAPVSQIREASERITQLNLSERLPVASTGDEIEQLSLSLNRMITRLDESFQHSRRFVADASHELRTPLTTLRAELEAMLQNPRLTPEIRDTVASLLEEAERLATIVEGLFSLSRLDAGEAQREWVGFDLGLLVMSTADQMSLLAEDKKISVTCDIPHNIFIEGDRARLKQVVVNLLDNAIKYTPEHGRIQLCVMASDSRAALEVSDSGPGIPAECLPHIFERFYRVDKARSRELGGAGLGLAIVKSICTANNAEVTVRSEPGQGTSFRVEFARHRPGADAGDVAAPRPHSKSEPKS